MMRRSLSVLLILCLLAALLAGCAGELPPLPTPPGKESGEAPEESVPPDESEVVVTAEPLELPEALEVSPAAYRPGITPPPFFLTCML